MNASLPPDAALRVFLVDHAVAVRQRIALLVGAIRGVAIVGEAEDGEDAWTQIVSSRADVVIVDLRLADGSGFDLIGMLSKAAPPVVTIVLTNHSARAFRGMCGSRRRSFLRQNRRIRRCMPRHRIAGARSRAPSLTEPE